MSFVNTICDLSLFHPYYMANRESIGQYRDPLKRSVKNLNGTTRVMVLCYHCFCQATNGNTPNIAQSSQRAKMFFPKALATTKTDMQAHKNPVRSLQKSTEQKIDTNYKAKRPKIAEERAKNTEDGNCILAKAGELVSVDDVLDRNLSIDSTVLRDWLNGDFDLSVTSFPKIAEGGDSSLPVKPSDNAEVSIQIFDETKFLDSQLFPRSIQMVTKEQDPLVKDRCIPKKLLDQSNSTNSLWKFMQEEGDDQLYSEMPSFNDHLNILYGANTEMIFFDDFLEGVHGVSTDVKSSHT